MRTPTEPDISIGRRIAALRKENAMRQEDLAEKLDISIKHMGEVERGLTCLSIKKLISLCDILSTDMDYLIRGTDNRNDEAANVPRYVLELFNSDDKYQQELLQENLRLFKKHMTTNKAIAAARWLYLWSYVLIYSKILKCP